MLINSADNDNNLKRICAKMSESFSSYKNNAQVSNSVENLNCFRDINNSENKNNSNLTYDHMYESNDTNGDLDHNPNCQSAENEVKFLKEWLLLHLDLIQQQNDEILTKENTILILQQENEMLKERLSAIERGSPYQQSKYFNCNSSPRYLSETFAEDMTQDSGPSEEDNKEHIQLLNLECNRPANHDVPKNAPVFTDTRAECLETLKTETEHALNDGEAEFHLENSVLTFNDTNFTIHNLNNPDSGKTLRMSIRRKRVCSNSSAVSNNDSNADEKRCRKVRRRRKRNVKDEEILTCADQYVTQTGEVAYGLINEQETAMEMAAAAADSANLEVPRWRVKVYTSCYTMEGTENLDDEVYNKRHSRLENDERRRKRWDVQRIREQRVVEKLKQRQERIGSGAKNGEPMELVQSLWPTVDEIRGLEMVEVLPVSAFGCPVAQFPQSEFSLPWANNPNRTAKKVAARKSTVRRKGAKR